MAKYYDSEQYISHSGGTNSLFDKIYLLARSFTHQWKYKLIKQYAASNETILDYGCGTGELLNFVQKKGFQVFGVEPNELARKKANLKLQGGISENLESLKKYSFSVITLWHVLEHIHNLNETIQNLKSLLTESGHLIIAVPNFKSHDSLKYKDSWAGYDVPRHLWHFSQETMNKLLEKNGLTIVNIKPMILDSYYVSLLSEGYQKPEQSKLKKGIKAFLEGIKSNNSARKNSQYSSLIYIAKPK
jgi:2-polyprenyl-3-methyl-5-hydroxy-6-metoxy-1,4-benzoquinol methylase